MKRKEIKTVTAIISMVMCLIIVFNSSALAAESNKNFMKVDSITINDRCGVVVGKSVQLTATLMPESASKSAVEWSSSNPSVIECTSDGYITGKKSGSYADIICEAKWDDAKNTIRIYCVESIGEYEYSNFKDAVTFIYAQPSFSILPSSIHFDMNAILRHLANMITIISVAIPNSVTTPNAFELSSGKCQIRGRYGSYAYIAYSATTSAKDGFVKYTKLEETTENFLNLSATDMDVWGNGIAYENRKLSAIYEGKVEKWTVADESIATYDDTTKQVVGHKPGTTTITASADGMTATCIIHSLYKWPQAWTGKTNKATSIYTVEGSEYKSNKSLSVGKEFIVYGDTGESDGWAYGKAKIGDDDYWGYVPIKDISTKGTISQYNNMTTTLNNRKVPVVWPMYDKSIKNISSPYGPRNITELGTIHHRGYDITTGTPGEIAGEYVVASFSGTVKKVYNNTTDCGYSISISSDCVDPVTGKKISIIYMHLLEKPKYEDGKSISVGDYIQVGTIIGKTGKSNGNTDPEMGYHLHFEANSQNAAVGDSGRSDFTYTLNPMFFFINKNVTFSGTKSYKKYGGYWYDLNGEYQNEEIFKSYFVF